MLLCHRMHASWAGRSHTCRHKMQPAPSRASTRCRAKPKGKDNKQKGKSKLADLLEKKQAAESQKELAKPEQYRDPEIRALLLMVVQSYWKHTGKYLIEADFDTLPDAIFNAPFMMLVHNRFQEGVTDPVFIYANRAALELYGGTWDEIIGIPSTRSAAPVEDIQEDRNKLLDKAAETGVVYGYEGQRVSLKGDKFKIKGVTLFNVQEPDGTKIGQCAVTDVYELPNGTTVQIKGYEQATAAAMAEAAAVAPPSEEELQAAKDGVQQWADYVRNLKEVQGLTNKDPNVQQAVQNLQAWKAQLATLEKRLQDALEAQKAAFPDEEDEE